MDKLITDSGLRGQDREKNSEREEYLSEGYFSHRQWASFAFQVQSIYKILGDEKSSILEIGCGNGFVNSMLRTIGYNAETLDINERLNPTYVGDISSTSLPVQETFDLVLCAEMLEHLPFSDFDICLHNIYRLSKRFALITIPDCICRVCVSFQINSKEFDWRFLRGLKKTNQMHFWELNSEKKTTYAEIRKHIQKEFSILREGSVKGNGFHYYYLLERK